MRHKIAGNKLSRNMSLRKATVRDIAKATLIRQRICTTKARAKEARKLVDRLITLSKTGTLANKRRAFAVLCDHRLVSKLFSRTAVLFKERVGGYTRIIPIGPRKGDNAQLVYLELTDQEKVVVSKPKSTAQVKQKLSKPTKIQAEDAQVVDTQIQEEGEEKQTVKDAAKDSFQKKEVKRAQPKESPAKQDTSKNKFSGIRKIFRRKTD